MKTLKRLEKNHVWTWIGHSFVAIMAPAALLIPLKALWLAPGFLSFLAYVVGVVLMALFYWDREKGDKAAYGEKGTLDKRQADLTGRIDGAGDVIGPYAAVRLHDLLEHAAATALLTALTMFGGWWVPIVPVAIATAFVAYETGRAS